MSQDFPPTGQLSGSGSLRRGAEGRSPEPPVLSLYSDSPIYEIGAMINLVRVRPQTLWTWAQHLGIAGAAGYDPNGTRRRYSERDLVALLWLKDMVIAGELPADAAARLLNAQRGMRGGGYTGYTGYGGTDALTSGALGSGALDQNAPPTWGTGAANSGVLGGMNSGALHAPPISSAAPIYEPPNFGGAEPWPTPAPPTGGLGGAYAAALGLGTPLGTQPGTQPGRGAPADSWRQERPWNSGMRNTAEMRTASRSGPLRSDMPAAGQPLQQGGPSGWLGSVYSGASGASGALEASAYAARTNSPSHSLNSMRELRPLLTPLLQAFSRFDTARANAIMSEALREHGVENVCMGLAQPAAARISELWSKSEWTNPEERFALNYLRGFMYGIYHTTHEPMGAPLAIVGCAPNETSDFGALLLAVLWRRAGLRIAYLGRGVDGDQVVQGRWPIPPAIIALTATSSQRIRALARIGKKVTELPAPQPLFAFWGPIFVRNLDLKRKINGVYLGDDAATATQYVRRWLNLDGLSE